MNKKFKIFWAYSPIILFFVSIGGFLCISLQDSDGLVLGGEQILCAVCLIGLILSVILTYISMVIFIVAACKNPLFNTGKKVFWGIMCYIFNMFAYPVYLHKYILKEQEVA